MLGLKEAQLQGAFLGVEYSLTAAELGDLAVLRGADAILVAGTPGRVLAVVEAVSEQGVPVFNIAAPQDTLRTACAPNLLHTIPSDAMLATAVAQWKQTSDASSVAAQAWHPDFVKFAARDLNKRYQEAAGSDMDDESWAAWAAVRIIADAAVNLPEGTIAERLEYMRSEMEFDGQKGDYMTFRDTGQLRQLLLVVVDGELAGEAPVRGVAASDDLDSLDPLVCASP
jgi:ABC-type branched-subunit amino acid transport system substrate-binding protein